MNDSELNRILKAAAPPVRPADYWEDFSGQVCRQLNRPLRESRPAQLWVPRPAWVGGVIIVLALVGFIVGGNSPRQAPATNEGPLLASEKLIREVTGMFPNRLRAIVKDESGMRLVLSESEDVPGSAPLWVKICRGAQCTSVITFSGQELDLAGQKLTVLADSRSGVILMGEHFAWASDGITEGAQDWKIQARPIRLAAR